MLLGDKSSFAIECEIVERAIADGRAWTFGHFCFWAGGARIGNYEDHVTLDACARWLSQFLEFEEDRWEPDFDELSREELYARLLGNVYDSQTYEEPHYRDQRNRFELDSVGMSAFSETCHVALVVGKQSRQRLVWRNFSDDVVREALLFPGAFEQVARSFLAWFRSEEAAAG